MEKFLILIMLSCFFVSCWAWRSMSKDEAWQRMINHVTLGQAQGDIQLLLNSWWHPVLLKPVLSKVKGLRVIPFFIRSQGDIGNSCYTELLFCYAEFNEAWRKRITYNVLNIYLLYNYFKLFLDTSCPRPRSRCNNNFGR